MALPSNVSASGVGGSSLGRGGSGKKVSGKHASTSQVVQGKGKAPAAAASECRNARKPGRGHGGRNGKARISHDLTPAGSFVIMLDDTKDEV